MNDNFIKQISISFENKEIEQKIARYIKERKHTIGVSQYIKTLVLEDMKKQKNTINGDDIYE